jgi:hypothetical protein
MNRNAVELRLLVSLAGEAPHEMSLKASASDTEEKGMEQHDNEAALEALTAGINARMECAQRIGKTGLWCFECGVLESDSPAQRCTCSFQESFGCSGRKVCGACGTAHERVARSLREMFAAKITVRADSMRLRLFDMLRDAACPEDYDGTEKEQLPPGAKLKFELAQCDPCDGRRELFRDAVLRAIRKSRFADFRDLAEKLDRAKDDWTLRAAVGLLRSPTRRLRAENKRVQAGQNLRAVREARGLSRKQCADALGWTEEFLAGLESGTATSTAALRSARALLSRSARVPAFSGK